MHVPHTWLLLLWYHTITVKNPRMAADRIRMSQKKQVSVGCKMALSKVMYFELSKKDDIENPALIFRSAKEVLFRPNCANGHGSIKGTLTIMPPPQHELVSAQVVSFFFTHTNTNYKYQSYDRLLLFQFKT